MVSPKLEVPNINKVSSLLKFKSFAEIINSLGLSELEETVDVETLDVNKNYNVIKLSNYKEKDP